MCLNEVKMVNLGRTVTYSLTNPIFSEEVNVTAQASGLPQIRRLLSLYGMWIRRLGNSRPVSAPTERALPMQNGTNISVSCGDQRNVATLVVQ